MNVVLRLDSELEAKVRVLVEKTGQDAEAVILESLKEILSAEALSTRVSREAWLRDFNQYLATMRPGHPGADFSRESAYQGRDE